MALGPVRRAVRLSLRIATLWRRVWRQWISIRRPFRLAAMALVLTDAFRYVRFLLRVRAMNEHSFPSHPLSSRLVPDKLRRFVKRLLLNEPDPVRAIRGWTRGTALSDIPRASVLAALRYYISAQEDGARSDDDEVVVTALSKEILKLWSDRCPELRTGLKKCVVDDARCIQDAGGDFSRLGRFPVYCAFKPTLVRLGIAVYRLWHVHAKLRMEGFSYECPHSWAHGITFWYRVGRDTRRPPLYFFHGLGLGAAPYIDNILCSLVRPDPHRTIVICEWPNLGHGVFRFKYPSADALADGLHLHLQLMWKRMQRRMDEDFENAVADVIGHSYGSAVIAQWARSYRNDLRRRVSCDPMSTGITFGSMVSYGYEPRLKSWSRLFRESPEPLIEYLIKLDIDTQQFLKREAYVFELWEVEDCGFDKNALLVLSKNDPLVNAEGIVELFHKWGLQANILLVPEWEHGDLCLGIDKIGVWGHIFRFVQND
jgi:pimeloyl-ACP methyl ester carboxylesterase